VSILRSEALVVRTVDFGESDVIATFVTEQVGKIGAVVRGARKGSRRVGGALEPVHTIAVLLDDKRGAELATLKEARIVRLRAGVAASLDALEVAGVALRWARHLFPPRTPEPAGWRVLVDLLDVLDSGTSSPRKELARAGLAMLVAVGYALDLERCVACGRPCPAGKAACIDPARGGLICRACGGAGSVLLPEARDAARALARGEPVDITDRQADELLAVVDRAMAAHTGFER
jgi:DNA repair protein RecO (recombination protein O)